MSEIEKAINIAKQKRFARNTFMVNEDKWNSLGLANLNKFKCILVTHTFMNPEKCTKLEGIGPAAIFVRVVNADQAKVAISITHPVFQNNKLDEIYWEYMMAFQSVVEKRTDLTLLVSVCEAWKLRHQQMGIPIQRLEELEEDFDGAVYLDYESLTFLMTISGKTFGEIAYKAETLISELHYQAETLLTK